MENGQWLTNRDHKYKQNAKSVGTASNDINDHIPLQKCGEIDPAKRLSDASINMNKLGAEGNV
jgi:hypothetical protein